MWTFFVVADHPVVGDFTNLFERLEEVCVEHFVAIGAVESLDVCVLSWFAWLYVLEVNAIFLTPRNEAGGDELWAVVDSDLLR